MQPVKSIVIVISGRGSNMAAIVDAVVAENFPLRVAAVLSNRPAAPGLEKAVSRGVETRVIDHRQFADREAFDAAMARAIDAFNPDFVVLAGFMRILTDAFVQRYAGRMVSIHPALLPAFPGLHTHRRALEKGVRVHGCTVHFVTPALDQGPIIAQAAVPVLDGDDETSLAARVLRQEHRLYPQVVRWIAEESVRLVDGRVVCDLPQDAATALVSPLAL